jgi:hypothetical protein
MDFGGELAAGIEDTDGRRVPRVDGPLDISNTAV